MAPSNSIVDSTRDELTPKEESKLRRPAVEKMRRDRINGSIETESQKHHPSSKLEKAGILEMAVSYLKQQSQQQLRSEHFIPSSLSQPLLLDQIEFILVGRELQLLFCFLCVSAADFKRRLQQDYTKGYSRCLQETLSYLSLHDPKKDTGPKLLSHFHRAESPAKDPCLPMSPLHSGSRPTSLTTALWRPW
nr:PREDICTED: transcription factor HES-5-like [Latimeria chalumnae]|eukprot:XP_014339392.1 PREDICTED: transcription factor HES-5-like [Latimeria chalumnae]